MNINVKDGLPFIELELIHGNKVAKLENVLLDTGSASTIVSADIAIDLGLGPGPQDELFRICGVGGSEYVYEKIVEEIRLGTVGILDFRIDVGAMNYGFDIEAILGMDFLMSVGLIIDTNKMIVYSTK